MPAFCAHVVFRGILSEPDGGLPACLDVIVLGAANLDEARLEVERFAKAREGEVVELPQGPGSLEYAGIRSLDEVEIPAPPAPVRLLRLSLEPDDEEQIDALVDGDFVHAVVGW